MNRNVAQSARATALAQQLEGRALALEFEGTPFTLAFRVARDTSRSTRAPKMRLTPL